MRLYAMRDQLYSMHVAASEACFFKLWDIPELDMPLLAHATRCSVATVDTIVWDFEVTPQQRIPRSPTEALHFRFAVTVPRCKTWG